MRWFDVALMASLLTVVVPEAGATTGGPLLVRVLGWDSGSRRVYCHQIGVDESLERECVYYFDLTAKQPERAIVVPWSIGAHPDRDTVFTKRFATLVGRLRPLEPEFASSKPASVVVISDSAVSTPAFEGTRRVVDVVREILGPVELRVATYRSGDDVRFLREYRLPGFAERLVIVTFIGDPYEGGYEIQQAVVLGPRARRPQLLDSSWGALPWPKR